MDYSGVFTVEIYGDKGWEVVSTYTDWESASKDSQRYCYLFQVRVTSPQISKEELEKRIAEDVDTDVFAVDF